MIRIISSARLAAVEESLATESTGRTEAEAALAEARDRIRRLETLESLHRRGLDYAEQEVRAAHQREIDTEWARYQTGRDSAAEIAHAHRVAEQRIEEVLAGLHAALSDPAGVLPEPPESPTSQRWELFARSTVVLYALRRAAETAPSEEDRRMYVEVEEQMTARYRHALGSGAGDEAPRFRSALVLDPADDMAAPEAATVDAL